MIHIVNPQTSEILDYITLDNIIEDTHKKSLESYIETYDAIVLGGNDFSYDQYLEKRNHIIIPDEDGTYQEFVLFEVDKYRDTEGRKTHFYAHATYLELKKAKVIYPTRREGFTLSQHAGWALNDTGWRVGIVESEGVRTFNIENHTNPYEFIKRLANEFEVEIRFRVEHDGRRITARYVDFLERIGDWKGREVEFGRDLDSIRRIEKQDVVTALLGLGPERDDGTRLEVLVEDEEALRRWGRVDEHGNLHHLIEPYEIQSDRQEMTEEEARQYTRTALDKRINTQVTYETTILDLEEVPGLEHEKIRFGDTIRIKDTYFNPPLYLEARVYEIERSIKSKAKKDIKLGDYIEYTEEEVHAIWNQLRNEIIRRLNRMAIVSITSTAGNVFKNAQGETQLTARAFVSGSERDEDGTLYDYQWMRFDKDGNHDTDFYAEGKTITVKASDIDEKATYRVLVAYELEVINTAEITISNVFDGEDGEPGPPGPKGEDGKTFYTWIKYADTPTSGMSDSPEGKEYIGIAYNKETPTPSTNYADYVWAKFKGEQGIPGPPGEDGQPTYTWVKYADDEHGNGMSDSPDGKLYIGLAFNKTTPEESNNPADYTWSLMPQNIEIGGRNYFVIKDAVENKILRWANGEELSETGSLTSGFIPCAPLERFICNFVNQQTFYYNSNKEYIGATYESIGVIPENTDNLPSKPSTMPDDNVPAYVRIAFRNNFLNGRTKEEVKIMLEKGDKSTDWTPAPEDVQEQIDEAKQEAEEAKQEAQQAKTTADGKNSVFTQPTAPPTTGRKIGDVWFDTSRDNLMHRFNGVEWVEAKWGEQSIVANSITANHIKSLVGLNVNDQFIVDSQGNVKFAGNLEGASGTFGEVTVNEGNITIKDANSNVKQILTPKPNLIGDHSFEDVLVDWNTENTQYNWYDMVNPPYADSDFSIHRPYWTKYGSPKVAKQPDYGVWDYRALPIFDRQAIVVRDANFVRQYIAEGIGAGGTYTISGYFKRHWGQSPGIPRFEIDHMRSGQMLSRLINQTFERVPNDYTVVRFAATFTLPSNFREGDYLDIKVSGGDSNWVQCDGVQLVEGNLPCIYDPEITAYEAKRKTEVFTEPLWQGALYPLSTHTIYPMLPITQCKTGWILRWQAFNRNDGTVANSDFHYVHIPKIHVINNNGAGVRSVLGRGGVGVIGKYVYVYDDRIVGHDSNNQDANHNLVLTGVFEY